MGEWTDADGRRLSDELHKPGVMHRLLQMARWFVHDHPKYGREVYDEAKELLAEAIDQVRKTKPWDPDREAKKKTFLVHMHDVMRQILVERDRSARGRREEVDSELARDDLLPSPVLLPDEQLHALRKLRWLEVLGQMLLDELKGRDPIAARSLVLGSREMSQAEQAAEIGCSVQQIEEAQRRLKYQAARIREAWEKREAQRMRAARKLADEQAIEGSKRRGKEPFASEDDG